MHLIATNLASSDISSVLA